MALLLSPPGCQWRANVHRGSHLKGLIRQRGDAWELRVYLGNDPVTSKQRYASRAVRGGKREAQRVLNEMVSEAERGLAVRSSATVGELLEAWFEMAKGDFSSSTVKETRGFIDRNLLPRLAAVPLSKLKASDLDRFYRQLIATGGVGGRPLSPATATAVRPPRAAYLNIDSRETEHLNPSGRTLMLVGFSSFRWG